MGRLQVLVFCLAIWSPKGSRGENAAGGATPVTCSATSVVRGDTAVVSCRFPVDVSTVRPVFISVEHLVNDATKTALECRWLLEAEAIECTETEGFSQHGPVGLKLQMNITKMSEAYEGNYTCKIMTDKLPIEQLVPEVCYLHQLSDYVTKAVDIHDVTKQPIGVFEVTVARVEGEQSSQDGPNVIGIAVGVGVGVVVVVLFIIIIVVIVKRKRGSASQSNTEDNPEEGGTRTSTQKGNFFSRLFSPKTDGGAVRKGEDAETMLPPGDLDNGSKDPANASTGDGDGGHSDPLLTSNGSVQVGEEATRVESEEHSDEKDEEEKEKETEGEGEAGATTERKDDEADDAGNDVGPDQRHARPGADES